MPVPTRLRLIGPATMLAMVAGFLATVAPPAQSAPPGDDTPVLLTPKGEHETGEEEAGFDKLRDAYYWSRLLSGDEPISVAEAASLRSKAVKQANAIPHSAPPGATRGGAWTGQGPNPIVQVGSHVQHVRGRGRPRSAHWPSARTAPSSSARLRVASGPTTQARAPGRRALPTPTPSPSGRWRSRRATTTIVYMGSGEGALSGDSYYGDGVYRSTDGGVTLAARVHAVHRPGGLRDRGRSDQPAAPLRRDVARPRWQPPHDQPHRQQRTASTSRPTAARPGPCARAPPSELHGATDLVIDPQHPQHPVRLVLG